MKVGKEAYLADKKIHCRAGKLNTFFAPSDSDAQISLER